MAKILFATWPYAGHVHPCIALANRLRERGHEIAFYTGAMGEDALSDAGYPRFPFRRLVEQLAHLTGSPKADNSELYRAVNRRYTTVTAGSRSARLDRVRQLLTEVTAGTIQAQAEDLEEVLCSWRPQLLLTDVMFWGPFLLTSEIANIPVVPFSFYAGCLLPGSRLRAPGTGLPPAATPWTKLLNWGAGALMRALARDVRHSVDQSRKNFGLAPLNCSVAEQSGRMPLYLVASSAEFDYRRDDLGTSVHYVGPCLWEKYSPVSNLDLEKYREIVYVSEGTAQVGEPFLIRSAVEGLSGKDLHVVVTTGLHRSPESLGLAASASEVTLRQWVPHREVFSRASVVVTTGGSSTVRQALACGVPVLIVPLEWDQFENAQRLVSVGAGVQISRPRCTAATISGAVDQLRSKLSYRLRAQEISASFRRAEESEEALERVEALAMQSKAVRIGGNGR